LTVTLHDRRSYRVTISKCDVVATILWRLQRNSSDRAWYAVTATVNGIISKFQQRRHFVPVRFDARADAQCRRRHVALHCNPWLQCTDSMFDAVSQ
jgi:hypothetical protein